MRPPIRDPRTRRKDVLLRGEEDVIRAAKELAERCGVSRNDALNAMLRAFVQDEVDPALRLATLIHATIAAGVAATVEASGRRRVDDQHPHASGGRPVVVESFLRGKRGKRGPTFAEWKARQKFRCPDCNVDRKAVGVHGAAL